MPVRLPTGWVVGLNILGWPVIHLTVAWIVTRLPARWFAGEGGRTGVWEIPFYEKGLGVAQDVQQAIEIVLQSGKPFDLNPAPAPVRKVQHQIAESRRLASESVGEDPNRRLRILPTRLG